MGLTEAAGGATAQLELFAGFAMPAPAALAPRKRWSRKTRAVASPLFEQLAFDLRPVSYTHLRAHET